MPKPFLTSYNNHSKKSETSTLTSADYSKPKFANHRWHSIKGNSALNSNKPLVYKNHIPARINSGVKKYNLSSHSTANRKFAPRRVIRTNLVSK